MVVKARTSFKISGHDPLLLSTLPGFLLTQGESQASPWLQASEICLVLPHYLTSPLTLDAPTPAVCTSYSLCLPCSPHSLSTLLHSCHRLYEALFKVSAPIPTLHSWLPLILCVFIFSYSNCHTSKNIWFTDLCKLILLLPLLQNVSPVKAGIAVQLIDLSSVPKQGLHHKSCGINIF